MRSSSPKNNSAMKIFTGSNGKPQAVQQSVHIPVEVPVVIPETIQTSVEPAQQWINPFASRSDSLSIPETQTNEVSLDDILEDSETNIKLAHAHNNAVALLHDSINALSLKLDNVKADKLPSVIAAASKTIESIRKERNENAKTNKGKDVHYHFYTPVQKKLTDYEVIEVEGMLEPGMENSSNA